MKVLLTGATGFIGKEVLAQAATDYRCVYRYGQPAKGDFFLVDGIDSQTSWEGAFDGCEAVIHLAGVAHNRASSIDDYYEINVEGTINLARSAALAGVKRFVFVSTVGVLGNQTGNNKRLTSRCPALPHNEYAKSKWQAEKALLELQSQLGIEVVIVRPPLVYGVDAPGNFGLLTKLVKLMPVLPFGSVNNQRSVISCSNLADFLYHCTHTPEVVGKTWLIAEPNPVSTKELVCCIAEAQDKVCWQLPVPTSLMSFSAQLLGKKGMADQLLNDLVLEVGETLEQTGWKPKYSMKQSLAHTSKKEL